MEKQEVTQEMLPESLRLMQPSHPFFFTTENDDGTFNLAPFSWAKPTSHYPPMVTVSLVSKPQSQHSLVNIQRTKEFVINVVGLDLARELVMCGQKVPEGTNKLALVGLEVAPSRCVRPPRIARARAHVECRALGFVETGDHCLVVADVVAAAYSSGAYSESLLLRLEEARPCFHLQQYNRANSQIHIFLECTSARVVETPYLVPIPELQVPRDTW